MDSKKKQVLVDWLREAREMEMSMGKILGQYQEKMEQKGPEAGMLRKHAAKSRDHIFKIDKRLKDLGTGHSSTAAAKALVEGVLKSLEGDASRDGKVRMMIDGYLRAHMKIAHYEIILACARNSGDLSTAAACEDMLPEERELAVWFGKRLGPTAKDHLDALGA